MEYIIQEQQKISQIAKIKNPQSNKSDWKGLHISPFSVCWDITAKCNENCKFCFRELNKKDLDEYTHQYILSKILKSGVKKITFSGGEPLLVNHLPSLIKQTKECGLITSLVTNGILLLEKFDLIENYIDWITLPIDGSNEEVQRKVTREKDHLKRIFFLIDLLHKKNISIKINTVVTKNNIDDLEKIAEIVRNQKIQRWKIFQFIPIRGYAYQNCNEFEISDEKFNLSAINAKRIIDPEYTDVTIANKEYLQENYFSILQDGTVRVTVNKKDKIVGDLYTQSVREIWQSSFFNHEKHYRVRTSIHY